MIRTIYTGLTLLFMVSWGYAQPYHRLRTLGHTGDDYFYDFVSSTDGNYVAVGSIKGDNSVVQGPNLARDGLVAKVSPDGNIIWAFSFGGDLDEEFYRVIRHHGFYYCLGYTKSYIISGNNTKADMFLVKLNENGAVQWAKNFGNPTTNTNLQNDVGFLLSETSGPDIMVVGTTGHSNSDQSDIILFKVKPDGTVIFSKSYNDNNIGSSSDFARDILRVGNEYAIACNTHNSNYYVTREAVLLKINENGGLIWARAFNTPPLTGSTGIYSLLFDAQRNTLAAGGFWFEGSSGTYNQEPIVFNDIRWSDGAPVTGAGPRARVYSVNSKVYNVGYIYPKGNNQQEVLINLIAGAGVLNGDDVVLASLDPTFSVVTSSGTILNQRRFGGSGYEQVGRIRSIMGSNDLITMGFTNSLSSCGYDLYFNRLKANFQFDSTNSIFCTKNPNPINIGITAMNYTNVNFLNSILVEDLPSANWHANITSLPFKNVTSFLLLRYDRCGCSTGSVTTCSGSSGGSRTANFSLTQNETSGETDIKGDIDQIKKKDIAYFNFKIYDFNDFVYYETDDEGILKNGVKVKKGEKGLIAGFYFWKYEATLKDGTTDIQHGSFTVK
jgi:hypothetical protein